MSAKKLVQQRIVLTERRFAELVLWELSNPLNASSHSYKYRLAYVVNQECVLRYDNESGKGDHRHWGGEELSYEFISPEKLVDDFMQDIKRWNDENPDT